MKEEWGESMKENSKRNEKQIEKYIQEENWIWKNTEKNDENRRKEIW